MSFYVGAQIYLSSKDKPDNKQEISGLVICIVLV